MTDIQETEQEYRARIFTLDNKNLEFQQLSLMERLKTLAGADIDYNKMHGVDVHMKIAMILNGWLTFDSNKPWYRDFLVTSACLDVPDLERNMRGGGIQVTFQGIMHCAFLIDKMYREQGRLGLKQVEAYAHELSQR